MVGCWTCTYASSLCFSSQDHGRLPDKHLSEHSLFHVGRHSEDHGRLPADGMSKHSPFCWRKSLSRSRSCAEITLCGHHLRPSPFPPTSLAQAQSRRGAAAASQQVSSRANHHILTATIAGASLFAEVYLKQESFAEVLGPPQLQICGAVSLCALRSPLCDGREPRSSPRRWERRRRHSRRPEARAPA